jgi:hypothetical protein
LGDDSQSLYFGILDTCGRKVRAVIQAEEEVDQVALVGGDHGRKVEASVGQMGVRGGKHIRSRVGHVESPYHSVVVDNSFPLFGLLIVELDVVKLVRHADLVDVFLQPLDAVILRILAVATSRSAELALGRRATGLVREMVVLGWVRLLFINFFFCLLVFFRRKPRQNSMVLAKTAYALNAGEGKACSAAAAPNFGLEILIEEISSHFSFTCGKKS